MSYSFYASQTMRYELVSANNKNFNLNDYPIEPLDYKIIYEPDTRIENYKNSSMPELNKHFNMAGRGNIYRESCGTILGVRASKNHTLETLTPFFKACNKLDCPICFEHASTVKAINVYEHIKDIQDYLFTKGYPPASLVPKHYVISPPNDLNLWDIEDPVVFNENIKAFIKETIEPYFIGAVLWPHEFRFVNPDIRENLKHSQHLHVIAFGGKFPHYKDFEAKFGFQYYMKGYLNTKSDVVRCARYISTHCLFITKEVVRTSEWTESQLSSMKKNNEWLTFLKGDPLPIPEKNITRSMHSRPSYFYSGALLPHNKRYKKMPVSEKYKKGIKKMTFRRGVRDLDTNELLYNVLDGINFIILTKSGRWKKFDIESLIIQGPKKSEIIKFQVCKSKLKFGSLHREKKNISRIEFIKNLKSLDDVKLIFGGF